MGNCKYKLVYYIVDKQKDEYGRELTKEGSEEIK